MLKTQVLGNIGNDPDMRYSAGGTAFLRFNVASNYRTRSPEGEWQDSVEWVRVTVFGQRAESLATLLHKGMRIFADGRLEAKPWTDNQGQVRAGLELVASDVEFFSPRDTDGGQRPQQAQQQRQQPSRHPQTNQRPSGRQMPEGMAVHGGSGPQQRPLDDDLEDLPF